MYTGNYAQNSPKFGNALWETSNIPKNATTSGAYSWNGDTGYFVYDTMPVMKRGGGFYTTKTYTQTSVQPTIGIFYYIYDDGGRDAAIGFRPVINKIKQ